MYGNLYSSLLEGEQENMAHQETCHDREEVLNEDDIGDYCKKVVDFMQAHYIEGMISYLQERCLGNLNNNRETLPKILPQCQIKVKGN